MPKKIKVSIIIPCFNQAEYIVESIDSALNQTYTNIEVVIVNDGSTDNSSEIIQEYAKNRSNILFLDKKENKGVISARNMAIDASNGEYILPLDGDDIIEQTYVEKAVKILNEYSNVGIVYCKAKMFGVINQNWDLPTFDKNKILFSNQIFCTALFRKTDFYRAGKYKENMFDSYEDWDLWLSFIELGLDVYRIDEVLFSYRKYNQISRSDQNDRDFKNAYSKIGISHAKLYFTNELIFDAIWGGGILNFNYAELQNKHSILELKKLKYKKISKLLSLIVIVEAVVILINMIAFKT